MKRFLSALFLALFPLSASAPGQTGGGLALWQVGWPAAAQLPPRPSMDLTSKPLDKIPAGTVIGKFLPRGWSHLVMIAVPTLVPEDERDAPKIASHFARLFKFTVLANVVPGNPLERGFQLERVARGFAVTVGDHQMIISSANTMGTRWDPLSG